MRLTLEQWKNVAAIVSMGITMLGGVVGGRLALFEYWDVVKRGQVQETLKFVEWFNQGPVWKARTRLDDFWYENKDEARDRAQSTCTYRQYVIKRVTEKGLEGEVRKLNDFFELVNACVQSDLCDEPSAYALLGKPAEFHWNRHRYYIEYMRNCEQLNDKRFGQGLQEFVGRWKGEQR